MLGIGYEAKSLNIGGRGSGKTMAIWAMHGFSEIPECHMCGGTCNNGRGVFICTLRSGKKVAFCSGDCHRKHRIG